ncbi:MULTISPECIES: nucleotidyltransferase domain-containing protein [Paenibacillus]|uniref:Amino acid transporter n=1 Tax=Paenibacillus albilobatus TaxID=2716884 RepID=A0A920CCR1_9BACL|nr:MULTISPECIES: hypothetical protein [Paenibacillus]GIO34825.1 hypothetical protein J2TS6_59660 [Paenibacillus albilobatus]
MIHEKELGGIESLMASFQKPWFIAGGWTIDLAVGEATRSHKDMDICIFREDLAYALSFFNDWDINVAIPGEHRLEPVRHLGDVEPPRYCLHLFKGAAFLEILLTERSDEQVIFRKDRTVTMPIGDFAMGSLTRPFVNPAWQLLFKSLSTRPEDEHDFNVYMERSRDRKSKKWLLEQMIRLGGNRTWVDVLRDDLERENRA